MAMVTDALGMKKCNRHFCFQLFVFDYFLFDKLEKKFLLYMIISLHIYIYTNIYIKCHCIKDFVFNIYYCEHGIYSLLHPLFFVSGQRLMYQGPLVENKDAEFLMDCFTI